MSAFNSTVFSRREAQQLEYRLYARVFNTLDNFDAYDERLTDDDEIDVSDCIYQTIWSDKVQPHFKAGLLFCDKGFNIERGQWDRPDINEGTMFLILCEMGIRHYEDRRRSADEIPMWRENTREHMTPGRYIHINWEMNHIFTTASGKSVQLKVVQQAVGTARRQKSAGGGSNPRAQLSDMQTLLHQMSGKGGEAGRCDAGNKVSDMI